VRTALERGEVEAGPPLSVQLRQGLKGLWLRERRQEGRREEQRL
jgi:hypothetical protein